MASWSESASRYVARLSQEWNNDPFLLMDRPRLDADVGARPRNSRAPVASGQFVATKLAHFGIFAGRWSALQVSDLRALRRRPLPLRRPANVFIVNGPVEQ